MASSPAFPAGPADMPLWRAINPAPQPGAPIPAGEAADVVIVGAGVAGLSTALNLRREGVEVVVIDAVVASSDGACASAGIVAPQLVRNSPSSVIAKLGRARGSALLEMVAESGTHLFEAVAEHGIDCAPWQAGFLAPVAGRRRVLRLERAIRDWSPWRKDIRLLDASETRTMSGCIGYDGALLDPTGGGVDPVRLVDGMHRAAAAAGARIYRGARATGVVPDGARWRVETAAGAVIGRRVLLCANGGNAGLHPALRGTMLPLAVCEVATRPLPEEICRSILPNGHVLTDISTDVFSLRLDREGRLITALGASAGRSRSDIEDKVQSRLAAVIPGYRRVPLEFIWQATVWLNTNLLPRAVVLGDGLTAVQACNGRGLGNNMIIGREIARWLHRGDYVPLVPLVRPRRVPGFALLRHLPGLMMAGSAMARRMFETLPTIRQGGGAS